MEFPENLAELSADQLNELRSAADTAITAFAGNTGDVTAAELAEAEAHEAHLAAVDAEFSRRAELSSRTAELRERAAARAEAASQAETDAAAAAAAAEAASTEAASESTESTESAESTEAEGEGEGESNENESEQAGTEGEGSEGSGGEGQSNSTTQAGASNVTNGNLGGARPDLPGSRNRSGSTATITAAVDVPNVAAGTQFARLTDMAEAVIERFQTYVPPTGTGEGSDWRNHSFARISKGIPDNLKIRDRATEEEFWEVINRAIDETRLPQGNLVASGGWCSPSEVVYDLCEGESLDGILSSPEVGLGRGGIKYTMGPDWSDIYGNGFGVQTETQAIAGTAKTPFEITCPSFIEARLDAIYQFVKVPILTESTYPELVKRWLRGLTVSYAHKMNNRHITQIATALGTAEAATDLTTTAGNIAAALQIVGDAQRNARRWKFNQTLEMVIPFWVKGAIRTDLALRSGRQTSAVTDAEINSLFTSAYILPQWVYDYQDLAEDAVVYPNTFDVLIYKAGTFVKGTHDVIKLDTVYDAASLAVNTYTALFMEEGMNTMKMCQGGKKVTISTCSSGHTGSANIAECYNVGA